MTEFSTLIKDFYFKYKKEDNIHFLVDNEISEILK